MSRYNVYELLSLEIKLHAPFFMLQLPVACKSCPCGHVFISRKLHQVQVKKEQGNVKSEIVV